LNDELETEVGMTNVVTKGEFARLKGRTPSAVSNWIADGKITPAALIGKGPRARIWVERADADLAASLASGQQLAQANPIGPTLPRPLADAGQPAAAPQSEREADLARRAKADADRAEAEAIAARRKNEIDAGRLVDVSNLQLAAEMLAHAQVRIIMQLVARAEDHALIAARLGADGLRQTYKDFVDDQRTQMADGFRKLVDEFQRRRGDDRDNEYGGGDA
jgi:hypothetical protein